VILFSAVRCYLDTRDYLIKRALQNFNPGTITITALVLIGHIRILGIGLELA